MEASDAGSEFGFEFFGVSFAVEKDGHEDRVQGTGVQKNEQMDERAADHPGWDGPPMVSKYLA